MGGTTAYADANDDRLTITDANAENSYKVNSPAGEYGILSCSVGGAFDGSGDGGLCGLIYYQAGIAVLTASVFQSAILTVPTADALMDQAGNIITDLLTGSAITASCNAIRHRWF